MPKTSKTPRTFSTRDLIHQFAKLVPGAHVKIGRDDSLLSKFRDATGYDAIDIMYAMDLYRGRTPLDIRSFIRWCHRHDPLADEDGNPIPYEAREVAVAERLSGIRAPVDVLVYFDLYEDCHSSDDIAAFQQAKHDIEKFVTPILGPR